MAKLSVMGTGRFTERRFADTLGTLNLAWHRLLNDNGVFTRAYWCHIPVCGYVRPQVRWLFTRAYRHHIPVCAYQGVYPSRHLLHGWVELK